MSPERPHSAAGSLSRPGAPDDPGRTVTDTVTVRTGGPEPGDVSRLRVRDPVAVLLSRFPLITETFILREVCEMERQGRPVRLVPLIEEHPDVVHDEARRWIPRALTTPYLSPAILSAGWRRLRRDPGKLLRALHDQVRDALPSWNFLIRTLALFPKAVYLAERLEQEGIRHVHAHYATHPATVARVISALTDIEFSFTAHAHDIFVHHEMLGSKLREARFVRTISWFNRDYLLALFPDVAAEKIRVIRVGIDVDRYSHQPRDVGPGRRRHTATPEPAGITRSAEPRILCVAGLKPYKGIPVLLRACRRLRDQGLELRCDLVGDGPLRDDIERLIAELDLEETVRLLGARPEREVARRMRSATAVVLPSVVADDGQMEGIPVVLMEALASGVPVVTSEISGIPELVEDGVAGHLTEPGDHEGVADALRRLISDPAEARRLARNGRAVVHARHRLEDNVAQLLDELDRVDPDLPSEREERGDGALESGWQELRGRRIGRRRVHDRADSRVVELMAADGGEIRELVVKAQRHRRGQSRPPGERAAREFRTLRRLRLHGLGAPTPLELDVDRAAILMTRCPGSCLEERLRQIRSRLRPEPWRRLRRQLTATGEWLRGFQALAPPREPGREPDGLAETVLRRAAQDVETCRAAGLLKRHSDPVCWLELLRDSFRPASLPPVSSHGDFWPGNVLVDGERVRVIDFEGTDAGPRWADPAHFLVHMELYFAYPLLSRRIGGLATAFLEGFAGAGGVDEAALRFFRVATALRLLARSTAAGEGPDRASHQLSWRHRRHLRRIVEEG